MIDKELTKAEEEIMLVLWELQRAFVKEIREKFPDPKPAYNTVSTIVRILEQKGFVAHQAFGKTHQYFPTISKEEYRGFSANKLMESYFGNSVGALVSHFLKEKSINLTEADELLDLIEKLKK
ncbi:MAG: BlaI/MecI/CopY family transcriptional regulator [Spirosomataceae bacterium]